MDSSCSSNSWALTESKGVGVLGLKLRNRERKEAEKKMEFLLVNGGLLLNSELEIKLLLMLIGSEDGGRRRWT